jgi:hypothetical protein
MHRYTKEDSTKIYLVFFYALFHFLCILEVCTIFGNLNQKMDLEKLKNAEQYGPYPALSHSTHGLAAHYGSLAESAAWAGLDGPAHDQSRPGQRVSGARPGHPWWHGCHVLTGEGSSMRSSPIAPWLHGDSTEQGERSETSSERWHDVMM